MLLAGTPFGSALHNVFSQNGLPLFSIADLLDPTELYQTASRNYVERAV